MYYPLVKLETFWLNINWIFIPIVAATLGIVRFLIGPDTRSPTSREATAALRSDTTRRWSGLKLTEWGAGCQLIG